MYVIINLSTSHNKLNKLIIYFCLFDKMAENQTLPLEFSRTFYNHQVQQELTLNMSADRPKKVLQDKNNELNKAIVPIKEYSNKFLRSMTYKSKGQPPQRKINTQQRFNVILKKKNVFNKYLPKENISLLEDNWIKAHQDQAMIKVSRFSRSKRQNVKTESSAQNIENNFSQIQILDSSIFNLLAPTSNLLNSCVKSRFFDENHKDVNEKKNKSISIKNMQKKQNKQKISQSRGLQLFSKIFVRNKDEMFEKIQIKNKNQRSVVPKFYETEQNFQTRKLTPIQKNKKAKILIDTYRPKKKSLKKYYTIQNGEEHEQCFQLNGWETTI